MESFKVNYKLILTEGGLPIMMNTLTKAYAIQGQKVSEEDVQIFCNIIKIFGKMIQKKAKEYADNSISRQVFPEAKAKIYCKKPECLAAIVQLLLVKNSGIRKNVIKFIGRHFPSCLKETGIIDLLMICINKDTGLESLQLLYKIQEHFTHFNDGLDFTQFLPVDQELIGKSLKLRNSVFLRYLPVCLVRYLAEEENAKNVLTVFLSSDTTQPTLIWNKEQRSIFRRTLKAHLVELRGEIAEFVSKYNKVENIPLYRKHFSSVIKFPRIESEIRCGRFFLHIWNKANGLIDPREIDDFYLNLGQTLRTVEEKNSLEELDVVLRSFEIVFDMYNKT